MTIVLSGILIAASGWLGTALARRLCANIVPFADGPRVGSPPVAWLVLGSGVLGAAMAWRGAPAGALLLVAVVACALCASWSSDVTRGVVPDLFTLLPLAVVIAAAFVQAHWNVAFAAFVPFAPFALSAASSRGLGMGWGDVKLVALGGAVLGVRLSLVAFALACIVAVALHSVRRSRREPIAFAPYLACAVAVAMPFGLLVP